MTNTPWRRRDDALAAGGFFGLAVLTYAPMLLFDRLLVNADVFLAYLPAHLWLAEGLRAGELWLWAPHLLTGFPLAFTEYGWFYPPTWLALLVAPGPRGYWLAVALHAATAGIAAYVLARSWGRTPAAAGIAGATYQVSGTVAGGAALLNFGTVFWALPFLFWCVDGLRRAASSRGQIAWQSFVLRSLLASTAVGLVALSGHPQLVALVCLGAGAYAIVTTTAMTRSGGWRLWIAPAALLSGGLGAAPLAAIRILPTLEVAALSPRGQELEAASAVVGSALPWALVAGLALPGLEVLPVLSPTWVAYVGIVPLVLAFYAIWQMREASVPSRTVLLLATGLAGLILALGVFTPLYPLLLHVPGFALFRDPTRWLILWVFAVAMLASEGYDAWRGTVGARRTVPRPNGRRWPRLALLSVVVIVAGSLIGAVALILGRSVLVEQVGAPLAQRLAADSTRTFSAERYEITFAAYLTQAQRALDPRQLAVLGPLAGLVLAVWWSRSQREHAAVTLSVVTVPLLLFMWSRFPTVPPGVGADELARVAALPGFREGTSRLLSWKPLAAAYELNLA
ncbi:MAG: hypothetical protein CL878_13145, partial [Dehalococcoidia bacterium]|nr:hypothetical protein [Dehalococcoidia bacterium]